MAIPCDEATEIVFPSLIINLRQAMLRLFLGEQLSPLEEAAMPQVVKRGALRSTQTARFAMFLGYCTASTCWRSSAVVT